MQKSLYVIMFGDHEFFKIGISSSPLKRLAELQTASPKILSLVIEIQLPDLHAQGIEQAMHRRLHRYRVSGEWFAIALDQLSKDLEDVMRIYQTSKLRARQDYRMRRMQEDCDYLNKMAEILQRHMSKQVSRQTSNSKNS